MSGIRLHPEHGVNPSLDVCFWCGEPKGVALLGYNRGREAPRSVLTSFEPCDKCTSNMALGITFVEVRPARGDDAEIIKGVTPTGSWCVIRDDAVREFIKEPLLTQVLERRKVFIEPQTWDALGLLRETFDHSERFKQ